MLTATREPIMPRVVLLGDSILDNGAYVAGGDPVVGQLRARLPKGWNVTLAAMDGAVSLDVIDQLERLPQDATHLVVSAGGNDALICSPTVNSPANDAIALLTELAEIQNRFRLNYTRMLDALRKLRLPLAGCTVYDAIPGLSDIEKMALSLFNDVIVQELSAARLPILDLRRVCDEPRDYSDLSPIEPSEIGGAKITRALQQILLDHDFEAGRAVVYP